MPVKHWSSLALVPCLVLLAPAGANAESVVDAALEAPLAIESLLLDGAVVGSRLVVVGERGHILVSADHGASWTQGAGSHPRPADRGAHAR